MRQKLAGLAVMGTIGLGFGIGGATNAIAGTVPGGALHAHSASCVYGKIGGVRKCLRAGEYCARRYQNQYRRYGFTCNKLDYLGRWHLERR